MARRILVEVVRKAHTSADGTRHAVGSVVEVDAGEVTAFPDRLRPVPMAAPVPPVPPLHGGPGDGQ